MSESRCPKCKTGVLTTDSAGLTYCLNCAYEPPDSAALPLSEPDDFEPEAASKPVVITTAADMAKACEARIAAINVRLRTLEHEGRALKEESARLGKVVALLTGGKPKALKTVKTGDKSGLDKKLEAGPYPCETCGREFTLPTARGVHQKNCRGQAA